MKSERSIFAKKSAKILCRERKVLEEKLTGQIETLTVRSQELEAENRKLRDDRYTFDKKVRSQLCIDRLSNARVCVHVQVSELRQLLATCEGQLTCANKECDELRDANQTIIAEKQQLRVDLSYAHAETRALNEKVPRPNCMLT